jgi:cellulose synthase/poly-beta-1,6-N-acetylglucosamine synthase-like glycosyltransferase
MTIAQVIGPIGQYKENTKFFSAIPPKRLTRPNGALPHVTIQCPVYKEGLRNVIEPTIHSIKEAISTYEMQGGSANIFVNDDGMQLISETAAQERREFYEEHNIGWVARPKDNPDAKEGGKAFIRRGRFKKASNMNYALWVSQRVEDKLTDVLRPTVWTQDEEMSEYHKALAEVISEDEGQTWGEGNIRLGDYILLIDSDTRVPEDCLLDAVSEMEQSPHVAIIQYSSGVMNVTNSFFERGITFFTNLIYTAIRYAVANGDVSAFVGHNAILRWSAVQEIAYDCPLDNREKYWSEETVSEDFDMALRLQTAGYIIRLAAYTGDGFKEGVSLTVYDEITRWEKYAYGCNELIFHPVHQWIKRGPFTKLFRNFIMSNMPLPSKITIMAYIGTYYAIGSYWILTTLNYFIFGWFNGYYDHYYVDSWRVMLACIAVFTVVGNLALAVFRYRVEEQALFPALIENFKWIPLFFVFFGGISLHVSHALLAHMFGIKMTWGATSKEVEVISFFEEIPRVIKTFKWTFLISFALAVMMVFMSHFAPYLWRIDSLVAIFPLCLLAGCHFLLPIVLNPNLMLFTW